MIDTVARFLLGALNAHLESALGRDAEPYAVLSSMGTLDGSPAPGVEQKLVLTLVNLERDTMAAAAQPRPLHPAGRSFAQRSAPLNVNLYLLVSSQHAVYLESLKRLSLALGFVQSNALFDARSTPDFPDGLDRLALETVNVDLQGVNNLWGNLGLKYLPSFLLKVRTVGIDLGRVHARVPAILGVQPDIRPAPQARGAP